MGPSENLKTPRCRCLQFSTEQLLQARHEAAEPLHEILLRPFEGLEPFRRAGVAARGSRTAAATTARRLRSAGLAATASALRTELAEHVDRLGLEAAGAARALG